MRHLVCCFVVPILVSLCGCASRNIGGEDDPAADLAAVLPKEICPATPCPKGALCLAGACVPDLGPCTDDEACQNDSFCHGTMPGRCVPYGPRTKTSDPACKGGGFTPEELAAPMIRCEWTESAVIMAPVVIDLDGDGRPEILLVTYSGNVAAGSLVALRGDTCAQVFSKPAGLGTRSQLAAADLTGDKIPEIVGIDITGRVVVFDNKGDKLSTSDQVANTGAGAFKDGGAAIADLDGVAPPEIVYAGMALRFAGGRLQTLWNNTVTGGHWAALSAIADVDLDGKPDVAVGNRIFEGLTGQDKTPPGIGALPGGYVAVAQFDDATPEPEIVLISSQNGAAGSVRIYNPKTGRIVFGPYEFGQRWGGPPTVADFDGDGKPEVAAAGYQGYAVFDPDCAKNPLPAFCQGPGLRWLKVTKDFSSGSTGSSVFDFNGDGQAEVVYRDECWLRVYDGKTGKVRFASSITSGTIVELPVIADVNNDGHADIVVPSHRSGGCPMEADLGLAPGPGTQGIHVLQDPKNRWMPSRGIWNQHTYHITNVEDDGTIPLKERNNWDSWNNFRQNVQGLVKGEAPAPDLTGGEGGNVDSSDCRTTWTLSANICNRGARPAPGNVAGTFYVGDPRAGGMKICTGRTSRPLPAGACEAVRCDYKNPPPGAIDLWFRADDDGAGAGTEAECKEKNNLLHRPDAVCIRIG